MAHKPCLLQRVKPLQWLHCNKLCNSNAQRNNVLSTYLSSASNTIVMLSKAITGFYRKSAISQINYYKLSRFAGGKICANIKRKQNMEWINTITVVSKRINHRKIPEYIRRIKGFHKTKKLLLIIANRRTNKLISVEINLVGRNLCYSLLRPKPFCVLQILQKVMVSRAMQSRADQCLPRQWTIQKLTLIVALEVLSLYEVE